MRQKTILAADLFCGAGGTSTGLLQAMDALGLKVSLLAINHWQIAIETHALNHPRVQHVCDELENIDPRELVPGGKLRILVASPECTHFSNARGGRPVSKQSRATVKHVLRWLHNLDVQDVLIENVHEFQTWGPLHRHGQKKDTPIKERKGQFFRAFIRSLISMGYNVEWRTLCAADYGDPTTRKRLFIRASKTQSPIRWPAPTHANAKRSQMSLFDSSFEMRPWRTAREIIDWSDLGRSIFNRDKPISISTIRRIEAGLRKFSGLPFVLPLEGFFRGNQPRSVDDPLPTVVASRGVGSVVRPFIVNIRGGGDGYTRGASVEMHVGALTNHPAQALISPFLVEYHGASYDGGDRARSLDDPLPTLATSNQHGLAFLVLYNGVGIGQSVDDPLATMTSKDRFALCVPWVGGTYLLDIYLRMLKPSEMAAAHSFPTSYVFIGSRETKVRQIGNSVPVKLAEALVTSIMDGNR